MLQAGCEQAQFNRLLHVIKLIDGGVEVYIFYFVKRVYYVLKAGDEFFKLAGCECGTYGVHVT